MRKITFETNKVTARFSASGSTYACFSIPYGKGWTALVDGKETPVYQNLAYLCVPLSAGTHTVELRYHTPYLGVGFVLSVAGFVLFAFFAWRARRRSRATSAARGGMG